jgi:dephospho-CoA kinase
MKKILILGNARHGKDTVAELFNKHYNITFLSSSQAALDIFLYDKLKNKFNYKSKEEAHNDRINHRKLWYNEICNFNKNDKAKLAKEILNKANCYVGMRDNEEFIECNKQNLFDIIIWVDASDRLPIEENSFNINKSEADIIIENNTTLKDLERKIIRIGKLLI